MTWRTAALSCRGQVTVALMLGVYLTVGSRTHFNQMLNDAARADAGRAYSTANAVYQTAYAAVQVPAFVYADRVNPVPVLGAAVAGVAVTSAVAPFAFRAAGAGPAIVAGLYAVNGALGGLWWPFMSSMLANWAPAAELAYMYAVINTGLPGGIALGNAYTGLYYGVHGTAYRYSFFVVAAACALWTVTWLCAFHRYPADDPGVGPDELDHLSENVARSKISGGGGQVASAVPWRRMAVSGPVWCVLLANYGSTVFYTVLVVYMPAYLKNVLHVNVSRNGFMSAAPPLGQMIVMYATGAAASYLQRRAWTDVTTIRKTFTFVGMAGPACALAAAVTALAGQYAFYCTLVAAYAVSGAVFSGFRVSQLELAPNYAAAVTAAGDLVGSLAMNTAHVAFAAGAIGPETEQRTWDRLCWALSAVLVAFASPFLLFGTSEPQPWNDPAAT